MNNIAKSFLMFFLILLFMYTGITIVSIVLQAYSAEVYTSDAVTILEEYNYATDMQTTLVSNAEEKGYTMTITPSDSDGDGITDMACVETEYTLYMPIFNISGVTHTARAYAR